MMVIGMALEVFGVGAVLPAISLMVGGDSVATEFLAPFLPQGREDVSQGADAVWIAVPHWHILSEIHISFLFDLPADFICL